MEQNNYKAMSVSKYLSISPHLHIQQSQGKDARVSLGISKRLLSSSLSLLCHDACTYGAPNFLCLLGPTICMHICMQISNQICSELTQDRNTLLHAHKCCGACSTALLL